MILLVLFFFLLSPPAHALLIPTSQPVVIANGDFMCPNANYVMPSGFVCPAAGVIPPTIAPVCPNTGLVSRVVNCVRGALIWATNDFLGNFSNYMALTVNIAVLLAITLWGAVVALSASRPRQLQGGGFVLALKIGAVLMFTANFGGLYEPILYSLEWMLDAITSYAIAGLDVKCTFTNSVWEAIDCVLGNFIGGITASVPISGGITAFLAICMLSGGIGVSIFMFGMTMLIVILLAIVQAIYIFLSAYIAISFLVIVSPLFIPCILFRATKAYFEKWLRLLIGAFLQPIFLFAYLSMLITAFDVVVFTGPRSLYRTIAGNAVDSAGFSIGDYLYRANAYPMRAQLGSSMNVDPAELGAHSGNPLTQTGTFGNMGEWSAPGTGTLDSLTQGNNYEVSLPMRVVDFNQLATNQGMNVTDFAVRLLLSMAVAAIVAYIFYTMLKVVPYLATLLSGEVMSIPSFAKGGLGRLMGSNEGPKSDTLSRMDRQTSAPPKEK